MPSRNVLNSIQIKTIKLISKSELAKFYYWTGGTALTYKYLNNRRSEDLDFFSGNLLRDENLLIELNKFKKDLNITKIKLTRELNRQRFVLGFSNGQDLKLEFVFFPFKSLSKPVLDKKLRIRIDSLVDMATNKTLATFQRNEPKDIFDLYSLLINKKMRLSELIKKVDKKFGVKIDEADLEAKILDKVESLKEIKPLLLDKKDLDIDKIRDFFTKKSISYLKNFIF